MSIPRIGALNDFAALAPVLEATAKEFVLPYELLVAQTYQESGWKLKAYRYEPGYDRRYVSSTRGRSIWSRNAAWLRAGPTAIQWFEAHPERSRERSPGRDWTFIAQTRIAASYGPSQLMYPTASGLGHIGSPELLYEPSSVRLGAKLLAFHYRSAMARGLPEKDAMAVALASYNGGTVGNGDPLKLRNIDYVRHIDRRFRQCWGRPYFV